MPGCAKPLHGEIPAVLHTGFVLCREPDRDTRAKLARSLSVAQPCASPLAIERAYIATRVFPARRYRAAVQILENFAGQLASLAERILRRERRDEPGAIREARRIIESRYREDLSLANVACSVSMSSNYFSSRFKAATGMNMSDYVARVRIREAKARLATPDARISEIAFEVGFQSLCQFNRHFRRITGVTPTSFRTAMVQADFRP